MLNTSTRLDVQPPDAPNWWREDAVDHAFRTGAGFMRSLCRQVRWTVRLTPAMFGIPSNPCPTCDLIANGTEGEKAEAFGS